MFLLKFLFSLILVILGYVLVRGVNGEYNVRISSEHCLLTYALDNELSYYDKLRNSSYYRQNGMQCGNGLDVHTIHCTMTLEKLEWIGIWHDGRQDVAQIEQSSGSKNCMATFTESKDTRTCERFYNYQLSSKESTEVGLRDKILNLTKLVGDPENRCVVIESKYNNSLLQYRELKQHYENVIEKLKEKSIQKESVKSKGKFRREVHKPWLNTDNKVENSADSDKNGTKKNETEEECHQKSKVQKVISRMFVPLIMLEMIVNIILLYLVIEQIHNSWLKYKAGKRFWLIILFFYFLVESMYNLIIIVWHLIDNKSI